MPKTDYKKGSLGKGVYYETDDYASFGDRFLIIFVDLIVLTLMFAAIACANVYIGVDLINLSNSQILIFIFWSWLVVAYVYLVLLKRSDIGTLGYIVTGSKIVNLQGERPSIAIMSYRFLLLVFGPLHFLYDFFWLCNDINKQTLRDKLAQTYVIKRNASPAGHGEKGLVPFSFFLLFYQFTEVKRP